jgi:hypothetical protein
VPWDDDAAALAEEDALREADEEEDAEPDTPGAPRPPAVDSTAREIPKSMTRGPSSAISTFDGLRSRCTTPARWIALRLSARPAASVSSELAGSGPWSLIASASEGPGTYAVASHATGPSTSASTSVRDGRFRG